MSDSLKIYCRNLKAYIEVIGGERLAEVSARLSDRLGFTPICARVNNKTEGLQYAVFQPKQVEFMSQYTNSGERVYIRSLCMMLYRAVVECYPGARLRIEHSIAHGYYCRLHGEIDVDSTTVSNLRQAMLRMVERDIPYERKERLSADDIQIFESQGLNDKVKLLRSVPELYTV